MAGQPTRLYGLALGKEGNFQATTDGLITAGDTTPSVYTKSLFYSNNTTATTITDFDDGKEGQIITLIMLDGSTTVANSTTIYLAGTGDFGQSPGGTLTLIKRGASWYELARKTSTTAFTQAISSAQGSSQTIQNAAQIVRLLGTSGGVTICINNLSGGTIGQEIYLLSASDGKTAQILTGNNIYISTGRKTLTDKYGARLIKTGANVWSGVGV